MTTRKQRSLNHGGCEFGYMEFPEICEVCKEFVFFLPAMREKYIDVIGQYRGCRMRELIEDLRKWSECHERNRKNKTAV